MSQKNDFPRKHGRPIVSKCLELAAGITSLLYLEEHGKSAQRFQFSRKMVAISEVQSHLFYLLYFPTNLLYSAQC